MLTGLVLHPERGIGAVFAEARQADRQGYDSIWLPDHLMDTRRSQTPAGPLDSVTLMTALGAVTKRVRLAWSMLNVGFRHPAVLAKMLASLDQITHGRVICSLGSGWFKEEYEAYQVPLIDDHDARVGYAREVVQLIKELWTHPAPEEVTFEGRYVKAHKLAFNPATYQKPHPPIWFGGDSDASLSIVRDLADGWVMLTSGNRETLTKILGASNWPKRPMTVVKNVRLFVSENRRLALAEAERAYRANPSRQPGAPSSFEEYREREAVGTPDECLARLAEIQSWGVNYVRFNFDTPAQQARAARLMLPRLGK